MGAFDNRVALVTGGSSGIGLATARRLAEEGARVAIVDLRPPPDGTGDLVVEADVADPDAWSGIVAQVEDGLGGLDIAHLNAGVTTGEGDITRLTDAQYRRIMRVNVDGVVFGVRACVPALARRGGGVIVVTASLAGLLGFAHDPVYTATKHAVVGLVRALGPALVDRGIRINAVCPGMVETPLIAADVDRLHSAGFPLIAPERIADAVVTAATADATGQAYVVQPGLDPVEYRFRGVPGPRIAGAEGMRPPL